MISIFDMISYILIILIFAIVGKIWTSMDKYFEKKAENLASKQDIAEITASTEKVTTEYKQIYEKFTADLNFKYQFYEAQYKELYSELFLNICKSETFRYIYNSNSDAPPLAFCDYPILEYDAGETNEEVHKLINEIIGLVDKKHFYASPELLKIVQILKNNNNNPKNSVETEGVVKNIECRFKIMLVKTIIRDFYWLRQQLHLQENIEATNSITIETFMDSIL